MKDYGYKIRKVLNKNERLSKDEAWNFWKNTKDKDDDRSKNSPNNYIQGIEKSIYLADLIAKYLDKESRILEIGCNVGRNLNFLLNNNFKNLSGIEINKNAVGLCKKTYTALSSLDTFNIYNAKLYNFLPKHKNLYDVVFTLAVMMHIDDNEREIIYDYLEKYAKYVIFIEPINESKKNLGGRLFNIFDYDIHMKKRDFIQISHDKTSGSLRINFVFITFKNPNIIS